MRLSLFLSLALSAAAPLSAAGLRNIAIEAAPAYSVPFSGAWGDGDSGFKPAFGVTLRGVKRVDELLSYGLYGLYSGGHANRSVDGLEMSLSALGPFLKASFEEKDKTWYALVGTGAYLWNASSYGAFKAESGSNFGVTAAGGFVWNSKSRLKVGLEVAWHHVYGIEGKSLDLGAANNVMPSIKLEYHFTPLP